MNWDKPLDIHLGRRKQPHHRDGVCHDEHRLLPGLRLSMRFIYGNLLTQLPHAHHLGRHAHLNTPTSTQSFPLLAHNQTRTLAFRSLTDSNSHHPRTSMASGDHVNDTSYPPLKRKRPHISLLSYAPCQELETPRSKRLGRTTPHHEQHDHQQTRFYASH